MESQLTRFLADLPVLGGLLVTEEMLINEWALLAVLTVLVSVLTVLAVGPLAIIFRSLDTTVATVKNDDAFKADVAALAKRQKDSVKEYTKLSPPDPVPSHERHGWSVVSTSLLIGLFMAFIGAAFSNDFQGGDNSFGYSLGFAVAGIVTGLAFLNRKRIQATDASEGSPVSLGTVWVVLTGLIVLGLGVGVMMWVRTVGV